MSLFKSKKKNEPQFANNEEIERITQEWLDADTDLDLLEYAEANASDELKDELAAAGQTLLGSRDLF